MPTPTDKAEAAPLISDAPLKVAFAAVDCSNKDENVAESTITATPLAVCVTLNVCVDTPVSIFVPTPVCVKLAD
tara:strand:+ start:634 stop:855 length:222 start_codon:yes stop_codon:yes gene_type:complete